MVTFRKLGPADAAPLLAFLRGHPDTTLLLRSNAFSAGLEYHGRPFEADYVAAAEGKVVTGAAAHCWNGMLLLEAGPHAARLAREAVAGSRRAVAGVFAPVAQAEAAIEALGLAGAARRLDSLADLYVLDVADLELPAELAAGAVAVRRARAEDLDTLAVWRAAFLVESLHLKEGEATRARGREEVERTHARGNLWIAHAGGRPAATTAFSGRVEDAAQVGAVYTPPELRGRHYARCAVAGSLRDARAEGLCRAVLVTEDRAASRAYTAVGFARVGVMALVMFEEPQTGTVP